LLQKDIKKAIEESY